MNGYLVKQRLGYAQSVSPITSIYPKSEKFQGMGRSDENPNHFPIPPDKVSPQANVVSVGRKGKPFPKSKSIKTEIEAQHGKEKDS